MYFRPCRSAAGPALVFIALLLLPSTPANSETPPLALNHELTARVEIPGIAGIHVRKPVWSCLSEGRSHLALQAFYPNGSLAIAIAPDVSTQMRDNRVVASVTVPERLDALSVQGASLLMGAWHTGQRGAAFMFSANTREGGTMVLSRGAPFSLWEVDPDDPEISLSRLLGGRHGAGRADISFVHTFNGCPIAVCEYGQWGSTNTRDLAAFSISSPNPVVLFQTPKIAERSPQLCPDSKGVGKYVMAYLETTEARSGDPALNCALITYHADGSFTATPQFTDGGSESRSRLGIVDGFSWCPVVFEDPSRGRYGLLAYYRRTAKDVKSDVPWELWCVPVSMAGRMLPAFAFMIHPAVAVETSPLDPVTPSWDPTGTYLFFLEFRPGTNPAHVAHIPPTLHLVGGSPEVSSWTLNEWEGLETLPVNRSITSSCDGTYLAVIATGHHPQNPEMYYDNAYIIPVTWR